MGIFTTILKFKIIKKNKNFYIKNDVELDIPEFKI